MIIGTGTDLANIDRINKVLIRHGDRFRDRVFTKIEQAKARRRNILACCSPLAFFVARARVGRGVELKKK